MRPLTLGSVSRPQEDRLAAIGRQANEASGDVDAALRFAAALGRELPLPGGGSTAFLWSVLATVAAADLTTARVVEPHVDALAILHQAGAPASVGSTWGVYAAERPDLRVDAAEGAEEHSLTGVKPWCSLADRVDRALVTAHVDGGRRLFDVDLRDPGVAVERGAWHARGLIDVVSTSVTFHTVPARPVGGVDWYLRRPGFAWGGMGVAACWYGGAAALAEALLESTARREPDQLALAGLGAIDRTMASVRAVLSAAATAVDDGSAVGDSGAVLAERVRGVVANAAEQVVTTVGHLLGPAPLTMEAGHARRVADLTVYVRQHHAERDDARLGALVRRTSPAW